MKTTPWLPGFLKPVRVGLYPRRHSPNDAPRWSWWDGKRWMATQRSKELALRFKHCQSFYQELQWCGLTEDAYLEHFPGADFPPYLLSGGLVSPEQWRAARDGLQFVSRDKCGVIVHRRGA